MKTKSLPLRHLSALALACGLLAALPAEANDYPTADRVHYVQECMRQHPGSNYEMVSKCSCALDKIASQVTFDDYVVMSTASKANSIGGERGNQIRDTEQLQQQVRNYRKLQSSSKKSCFILTDPVNP